MTPALKRLAERALVVLAIGAVAVFSLSSWWAAYFVGGLTVLAVLYDMLAHAPPAHREPFTTEPTPQSISSGELPSIYPVRRRDRDP